MALFGFGPKTRKQLYAEARAHGYDTIAAGRLAKSGSNKSTDFQNALLSAGNLLEAGRLTHAAKSVHLTGAGRDLFYATGDQIEALRLQKALKGG